MPAGEFVNWSGTERRTPERWFAPYDETQVGAILRRAGAAGRRLRVVGSGHSFSAIAVPDQDALSLGRLGVPTHVNRAALRVRVSGGQRIADLTATLAREGLSLPVVGSIQAQTVAGAIATGTHGSSLTHGNLATLVTGLRLVTGTGEVLELTGDDPRLAAARVSLGALGVVTEVTLRVQPAGRLRQTVEHVPVAAVPGALAEIAASAEYVKVWWLPHAPLAQVVRYARTEEPATRRPSPVTQRWVDERVMHRWLFPALVRVQSARPGITAPVNARLSQVYLGPTSQVGPDMLMLNTPMPLRHRETEAALPLALAPDALRDVLALFDRGRPAANFPLEIRFVRGDDGWLSPAFSSGGADTCQIGAYSTGNDDCDAYFAAFWRVMRRFGARPHWGKELDHTADELRERYPRWAAFAALRDALDPGRVLANAFTDRVLGP
jgi:L-gulonolactone oxidase